MKRALLGSCLILSSLVFQVSCSDEGGEDGRTDSGSTADTAEDPGDETAATDTGAEMTTADTGDSGTEDGTTEVVEDVTEVTEEPLEDVGTDDDVGEITDTDVTTDITDADQDSWTGFEVTFGDVIDSGAPPACDTTVVADICTIICAITDLCFSSGVAECETGCTTNIADCTTVELEGICACVSTHLSCAAFDTWNDCMQDVSCTVPE